MINTLQPAMNLFLAMWSCIPTPLVAFVRWVLGLSIVIGLYFVVKDWIK